MKPLSQQPPLTLALAAFAGVGLLTLMAVLSPSWARLGEYDSVKIVSPRLLFPEPIRHGSFGDFAAVIDQPLFNADRQKDPAPPPSPSALAQLPSLDSYRLVGMVITGDKSLALIERRATKSVVELKTGDNLDGRTVKDITADGVVFGGSSTTETLSIPKAAGVHVVSEKPQKSGLGNSDKGQNSSGMGDRDTN